MRKENRTEKESTKSAYEEPMAEKDWKLSPPYSKLICNRVRAEKVRVA